MGNNKRGKEDEQVGNAMMKGTFLALIRCAHKCTQSSNKREADKVNEVEEKQKSAAECSQRPIGNPHIKM